MILLLGWNITGAAIATVIGNLLGACYYIFYFVRGKSSLSVRIQELAQDGKVCGPVCAIGIPAALGSILMSVSQIVINSRLSQYGDMAVAGMGVAMKVITITGMVCMGLGQGVQPLLGYCVGAKLWKRFRKAFRFSILFALALGAVLTVICYLFTNQIVSAFLSDPDAYSYAVDFFTHLADNKFPVRRVLCVGQLLAGYGCSNACPDHQPEPSGYHFHPGSVYFASNGWN